MHPILVRRKIYALDMQSNFIFTHRYPCTEVSNRHSYCYFVAFWWTSLLTLASPVLLSSFTNPTIVSDMNRFTLLPDLR